MTRTKLSNCLIGGFGAGGIACVLQGFVSHFTSLKGFALEHFLTLEFCGFILIFIAVLIRYKS